MKRFLSLILLAMFALQTPLVTMAMKRKTEDADGQPGSKQRRQGPTEESDRIARDAAANSWLRDLEIERRRRMQQSSAGQVQQAPAPQGHTS